MRRGTRARGTGRARRVARRRRRHLLHRARHHRTDDRRATPDRASCAGFACKCCKPRRLRERLTTSVADGDSLRYYPAYELPARRQLPAQNPTGAAWASQLLMVQRANGELTIGDTHAYAEPFPFDVEEEPYDQLRASAEALLGRPLPPTSRRWAGVYSEATDGHPVPPQRTGAGRPARHRPRRQGHDLLPRHRRRDLRVACHEHRCEPWSCWTWQARPSPTTAWCMEAFHAALADAGVARVAPARGGRADRARDDGPIEDRGLPPGPRDDESQAQRATVAFERRLRRLRCIAGRVTADPRREAVLEKLRASGRQNLPDDGLFARAPATCCSSSSAGSRPSISRCHRPMRAAAGRFPDLLWTAMLRLRAGSVDEVAVVGDTASDMQTGRRAGVGLRCGVLTGADDETRLRAGGATHVLNSVNRSPGRCI